MGKNDDKSSGKNPYKPDGRLERAAIFRFGRPLTFTESPELLGFSSSLFTTKAAYQMNGEFVVPPLQAYLTSGSVSLRLPQ